MFNNKGVVNLSSHVLTCHELSVLSRGLNFCPTPSSWDPSDIMEGLDKLHCSMRLAQFFQEAELKERDPSDGFSHKKFRPPSTFNPRGSNGLETFITNNYEAVSKLPTIRHKRWNISLQEKQAIKDLANNKSIVIKPADKGSGVVIMNTHDYILEAHRQLSDTNFYELLNSDLTTEFTLEIDTYLKRMYLNKEIDKKAYQFLSPSNYEATAGRFYLLPKIHKGVSPPPGRPIISAIKSPTERISQFLDHFLQPGLINIKSYVKDTGHFLYLIDQITGLDNTCLLVSFDVTSLYTNVPLEEARRAVASSLLKTRNHSDLPHTESLLFLLKLVFTKNIFSFSDGEKLTYYLQTNGVSMGSKCSPAVACTFMAYFEEKFVYSLPMNKQPLIWLRYIDDIFCIWPHGHDSLHEFHQYLNSCHPRIKFTSDISSNRLEFLDVTVHLTGDKLTTELFTKPTSSLAYLKRDSFHPKPVFGALPFGEFIRTRRNCSSDESYDLQSQRLLQAFLNRGYFLEDLQSARLKARKLNRSQLLEKYASLDSPQDTTCLSQDSFFLTLKFHSSGGLVRDIVKNNWTILGNSQATTDLFQRKLVVGYKRNRRLRDILVKSSLPINQNYGKSGKSSNVCIKTPCDYCSKLDTSGKITSTTTQQRFTAKHNVCCTSSNLIYCLTCKTCKKQYVGMTKRRLRDRLYQHWRNIRLGNTDDPIGRHFSDGAHSKDPSTVLVHVLSFITKTPDSPVALKMRLKFELAWIHRLRTTLPRGLNAMD